MAQTKIRQGQIDFSGKIYAGSTVISITANSLYTFTHNLGISGSYIFLAINGDRTANAVEFNGIGTKSSNSTQVYCSGGTNGSARLDYIIITY